MKTALLIAILATSVLAQSTPSFTPKNCQTIYPKTDKSNEGCESCKTFDGAYYKYEFKSSRLLFEGRSLQVVTTKKKWTCGKCPSTCSACEQSTDKLDVLCTVCPNGSFKKLTDGKWKSCTKCLSGCISCTTSTSCDMAKGCKIGYYKDTINSKCPACKTGCKSCTTAKTCQSCNTGYFLKVSDCLACSTGCHTCTDASHCSACTSSYDLKDGICILKPFYRQVWFWLVVVLFVAIAACIACVVIGKMKDQAFQAQNQNNQSMLSGHQQYQ